MTRIDCPRCALYDHTRGPRIRAEIAKTSKGKEAKERYAKFLVDYHDRHVQMGRTIALMSLIHESMSENEND